MAPTGTACICSKRSSPAEYGFKASALPSGQDGSLEFRLFFRDQAGRQISPWHSIPLVASGGLLNMVCEIPRNTRAKFEVSTSEQGNPIKQDVKKGKLRFYGIDMKWNYGMFPQTWEDPAHASADCGGFVGDNDPVDVVEVGNHDPSSGAVYPVKPIAALAMIDEGELDWKIVAVSRADPRFDLVNDVDDMDAHFPGELDAIREWFRTYKTHEGKPLNQFELGEKFAGKEYTMDVIAQTHGFWRALVQKAQSTEGSGKVAVGDVPIITSCFEAEAVQEVAPTAVDVAVEEHMRKLTLSEGVSEFKALPAGQAGTLDYRLFFANSTGSQVSPWHSIPLFANGGLLNMVCEIPRNTRAKFEVSTSEQGNPIKQDVKKGKLRFYGIDMKWNYGMFPQTWEDPAHASADCGGFVGDNDPVDVVEVGDHDPSSGAVYPVKPIAALAMIDEGELDWKIVAVSGADPRFHLVNDVADVEAHFPGELDAIREWFRTYKTHEGKPLNRFELNEEFVGSAYARDVIGQTHGFWRALVSKARSGGGSGKVAVGDVPIPNSSLPEKLTELSESAATEKALLDALHIQPQVSPMVGA